MTGRSEEAPRLHAFVVAAVTALVAIWTITSHPVGAFQDDAMYVVLAKALATGEGYRFVNLPGSPAATHYPPGYPLLLALLWKLWPSFPQNLALFKFANAALLAAAAVGTYRFAMALLPRLGSPVSAIVAVVGAVSIPMLMLTGVVMSEPLFLALLFPTLLLAERAASPEGDRGDAVLAGLAVGGLTLVRTLGLVALPAALLVMLLRRRWASAGLLAAAGVVVLLPWQLWAAAHKYDVPDVLLGKFGSYSLWLSNAYREGGLDFAMRVAARNASEIAWQFGYIVMPTASPAPRVLALAVLAALTALGTLRLWYRAPVTVLSLAAYMAVVVMWPFEPTRFLFAVWPLFVLVVALGMAEFADRVRLRVPGRVPRLAALLPALPLLLGYAAYNARGYREKWWEGPQRETAERARPIAEWVARHTEPDDALATEDDLLVFLYTGRRTVPNASFSAASRLRAVDAPEQARVIRSILEAYDVRYLIVAANRDVEAATSLATAAPGGPPPRLRRVASMRHALVFQPIR